jgi:ATP synthase protein I
MTIIAPPNAYRNAEEDRYEELEFKRLSPQEAKVLLKEHPSLSPWWVVGLQVVAGLVVALAAGLLAQRANAAWSAGYGALVVVIPAALFARGLTSQFSSMNAATAGFGFFVWEAVKIVVSGVMLFLAPRLIENLDWLMMLIGLIVTLKVYWLALAIRPKMSAQSASKE